MFGPQEVLGIGKFGFGSVHSSGNCGVLSIAARAGVPLLPLDAALLLSALALLPAPISGSVLVGATASLALSISAGRERLGAASTIGVLATFQRGLRWILSTSRYRPI